MPRRPPRLLGALWIGIFTVLGEALTERLRLPVPGSVLGMLGLFVALRSGLVKMEGVRFAGGLLIRHMGLFFVPAGVVAVGILPEVRGDWLGIAVAALVTTVLVAVVTAKIAGEPA